MACEVTYLLICRQIVIYLNSIPLHFYRNKDNIVHFAGFTAHNDPILDTNFYVANQLIHNLMVDHSPVVELIKAGDCTWRDYRL